MKILFVCCWFFVLHSVFVKASQRTNIKADKSFVCLLDAHSLLLLLLLLCWQWLFRDCASNSVRLCRSAQKRKRKKEKEKQKKNCGKSLSNQKDINLNVCVCVCVSVHTRLHVKTTGKIGGKSPSLWTLKVKPGSTNLMIWTQRHDPISANLEGQIWQSETGGGWANWCDPVGASVHRTRYWDTDNKIPLGQHSKLHLSEWPFFWPFFSKFQDKTSSSVENHFSGDDHTWKSFIYSIYIISLKMTDHFSQSWGWISHEEREREREREKERVFYHFFFLLSSNGQQLLLNCIHYVWEKLSLNGLRLPYKRVFASKNFIGKESWHQIFIKGFNDSIPI